MLVSNLMFSGVTVERMKQIFKSTGSLFVGLLFIALIALNFYHDLIDPYLWHQPIIKEWEDHGWKLVNTRDQPSLMFPWTLVWPPLGMLTFVDDGSVSKTDRTDGKAGELITAERQSLSETTTGE